jgi:hypothetical protein
MKLTQKDIRDILRLYGNQSYNQEAKEKWVLLGRKLCKVVAEKLGLTVDQFEIRVCRGGIAVGAGVALYTPAVYINFEPSCLSQHSFYWRTCDGLGNSGTGMRHRNRHEEMTDVLSNLDAFVGRVAGAYLVEMVERSQQQRE